MTFKFYATDGEQVLKLNESNIFKAEETAKDVLTGKTSVKEAIHKLPKAKHKELFRHMREKRKKGEAEEDFQLKKKPYGHEAFTRQLPSGKIVQIGSKGVKPIKIKKRAFEAITSLLSQPLYSDAAVKGIENPENFVTNALDTAMKEDYRGRIRDEYKSEWQNNPDFKEVVVHELVNKINERKQEIVDKAQREAEDKIEAERRMTEMPNVNFDGITKEEFRGLLENSSSMDMASVGKYDILSSNPGTKLFVKKTHDDTLDVDVITGAKIEPQNIWSDAAVKFSISKRPIVNGKIESWGRVNPKIKLQFPQYTIEGELVYSDEDKVAAKELERQRFDEKIVSKEDYLDQKGTLDQKYMQLAEEMIGKYI